MQQPPVSDEGGQLGRGDHYVEHKWVKPVIVEGGAAGADRPVDERGGVISNIAFVDFELDQGDEEGGDEGGAHFEHVEVEESIHDLSKRAMDLHLYENLFRAHLEHLVHVVEKGVEVAAEVGFICVRVHQHRVEDESVEH